MLSFDPLQQLIIKLLGLAIILCAVGIALKSGKGNLSSAMSAGAGTLIAVTVAALGLLMMGSQTDLGRRVLATLGLA